jgi:hypothetical protein
MTTPDEEVVMINQLLNVLRISEEWMDAKALTVERGSAFAGDDAKTHPYELSQGVAQSIAVAVDHLHCFRMALTGTGDNVLQLHTYAPFTLLRGAIENASTAVWVMTGSSREERIEAENCVGRVQPHRLHTTIERLDKVAHTIARLGKTMSIRIAPAYHQLRTQEIRMTADYRAKVEEEKERIREERERQREERAAALEFEREKARLGKEQSHYQAAMARLEAKGDTAAVAEMETKLREIEEAITGVEAREANIRAGYVYVISNIGAFGPQMVKIGMTRRLEPDTRVRELGDASVPFRFDTHALIFSEDAVGLETKLHDALSQQRVNKVNLRREFFYADPAQIRETLQQIAGQHLLEFRDVPEALEWRASGAHEQVTPASFEPSAT